jgi:hypothetical protein
MTNHRLLLISRDDISSVASSKDGERLFKALARLTRGDYELLATAPQPDKWSKKHGGPDDTLLGPDSIRRRLAGAGGLLEGVYYVPKSLLTQKRNREQALQDMMSRYAVKPKHCFLFSSSGKFVKAATEIGIKAVYLGQDRSLLAELEKLLD